MESQGDLNEGQWVAAVAFLLLFLVPLVVLAAAWLKRRYARAVVALQAGTAPSGGGTAAPEPPPPRTTPSAAPAALTLSVSAARELPPADHPGQAGLRLRRRVLVAQFAMGLLYWSWLLLAVVLALASVADTATGSDPVTLRDRFSGHLMLWPLLLAPPALAWAVQAGAPERRVWAGFGVLGACLALGLALGRSFEWATFLGLLAGLALAGALMVTFLRPAVRGAGPPLLAATVVGWLVLCALLAIAAAIFDDDSAGPPTASDWALFVLAVLALLLPAVWAGRRMLTRLARRYGEKRFSELQLALAAYWGVVTAFGLAMASLAAFDDKMAQSAGVGEWLAIVLLLAWWLWRLALRVVLWWITRRAPPPPGPLLFLRVFKPSSRSEAFTDRLLARWRFVAPTWMIAGPDLAGAYMEPDEFFAYLERRLAERYITREDEIPARLAALDGARDPDGRFRVNDLYCANTTWKATVLALMQQAGVVLLDLREYGSHRAGTRFELTELLRRAPLEKVLLMTDAAQDLPSLQREVHTLWAEVAAGRADAGRPAPLRLLQLDDSDAALQGLIAALSNAAGRSAR